MFRKRLAVTFVPLFIIASAGAAFADPVAQRPDSSEKASKANVNDTFSVLHAVGPWATNLSGMAEKKAKSELVKGFAREVMTANPNADAKLLRVAKEAGITVKPLDPQTEDGKSLLDRIKGETTLLGSLEGDAFDKEYMTLVTNTQQSVIHLLESTKTSAKDQAVKQYLGEMSTMVENRLKVAQDIMAKVYGDKI